MPACAACGADNPDDSRFCTSCGAPLAECRSCHFVNRAGDRFCSRCGTALGDVATTDVTAGGPPVVLPGRPRPRVVEWTAAAVALLAAALVIALIGVGSPGRSGDIPAGAIRVGGVDVASGRVIHLNLSNPVPVRGVLPARASGADSIRLRYRAAGITLGSGTVPLTASPEGQFSTSFKT